jgi:hypothetical protein
MSTYHYLLCVKCKEYCDGSTSNGDKKLIDSDLTISPFINFHAYCGNIKIINEQDPILEMDDDDPLNPYLRWTEENYKELENREMKL